MVSVIVYDFCGYREEVQARIEAVRKKMSASVVSEKPPIKVEEPPHIPLDLMVPLKKRIRHSDTAGDQLVLSDNKGLLEQLDAIKAYCDAQKRELTLLINFDIVRNTPAPMPYVILIKEGGLNGYDIRNEFYKYKNTVTRAFQATPEGRRSLFVVHGKNSAPVVR
jgi:hypothetical protein